mmetsp:Transcript_4000/g.8480  ORF Transcript_4000/g.8480 Transcript_4000/m.8480 type:complete len:387 (-) Transcript_4000:554-1714(-)
MGTGGNAVKGDVLIAKNDLINGHERDVPMKLSDAASKAGDERPWFVRRSMLFTWYIRGGMHVNENGMAVNAFYAPVFLAMTASPTSLHPTFTPIQLLGALYVIQVIHSLLMGYRTIYCLVVVTMYLSSLFVLPMTLSSPVVPTLSLVVFIAAWKVGICMSCCLHRYAAHAAFKCGPLTQLFINILGCLANQGGPIWWAAIHRCHHKYCDMPRDPHSAIQVGVERAFAFFGPGLGHGAVEEEFAPKYNDSWWLRLVDTWAFVPCSVEMYLAYRYFGREGLFVLYSSQWLCQVVTLWFNVVNHPPEAHPGKVCQATNKQSKSSHWYPMFWLLDRLMFLGALTGEAAHDDHHVHFMLAKREKYDVMYYSFLWPMEKLGLIWDVKVSPPE